MKMNRSNRTSTVLGLAVRSVATLLVATNSFAGTVSTNPKNAWPPGTTYTCHDFPLQSAKVKPINNIQVDLSKLAPANAKDLSYVGGLLSVSSNKAYMVWANRIIRVDLKTGKSKVIFRNPDNEPRLTQMVTEANKIFVIQDNHNDGSLSALIEVDPQLETVLVYPLPDQIVGQMAAAGGYILFNSANMADNRREFTLPRFDIARRSFDLISVPAVELFSVYVGASKDRLLVYNQWEFSEIDPATGKVIVQAADTVRGYRYDWRHAAGNFVKIGNQIIFGKDYLKTFSPTNYCDSYCASLGVNWSWQEERPYDLSFGFDGCLEGRSFQSIQLAGDSEVVVEGTFGISSKPGVMFLNVQTGDQEYVTVKSRSVVGAIYQNNLLYIAHGDLSTGKLNISIFQR